MTDNELIAEFIGGENSEYHQERIYFKPDGFMGSGWWHRDYLKFDTSWDWIMPVVEKIEQIIDSKMKELGPEITDLNDPKGWRAWDYQRIDLSTKIDEVYKSVIEFIKWYNQQKP